MNINENKISAEDKSWKNNNTLLKLKEKEFENDFNENFEMICENLPKVGHKNSQGGTVLPKECW